jgi:hypothetical protein
MQQHMQQQQLQHAAAPAAAAKAHICADFKVGGTTCM